MQTQTHEVYPRVYGGTDMGSASIPWLYGLSPRVRGNLSLWLSVSVSVSAWGLSPRVRGNPLSAAPVRATIWSIPACTGEPRALSVMFLHVKVYPRVYGGTFSKRT